ncbi:MAG: fosfomycin resistance protein FosB [Ilumatobacteraceae bacterium]|nr:fosfomycin resistance protein FosB [Ilumatobacteraceae bacterium]
MSVGGGADGGDSPSIAVQAVHHVSFRVDDLSSSLDFYCTLLGCRTLPRPDFGFPGAWLQAGDVQVHLIEAVANDINGFAPPAATPMTNHVAFAVADADRYREYLERKGFSIVTAVGAVQQFWVQDPSGNVLEFIARSG